MHFLATAAAEPAGTVRLVPSKGKLTRLAVLAPHRATGAGRLLVRAMEDWLVAEVRAGRLQHLVNEGRAGKAVHVKIHAQVRNAGEGGAQNAENAAGSAQNAPNQAHARSPLSGSTQSSGTLRRGRALTRRASRTSLWCATLRSRGYHAIATPKPR